MKSIGFQTLMQMYTSPEFMAGQKSDSKSDIQKIIT